MRVFSASIETFLHRVIVYTKHILSREFGVRVGRTRFHTADGWYWPIMIVAIDDEQRLGYFDAESCTIGINKCLMYTAKERVIKDLLRHELAHYFTFIAYRDSNEAYTSHGPAFQSICDTYGIAAHVRRATMDVRAENDAIEGDLGSEEVIAKVRKLMSLAASDNENEAALATLRANELIMKHNLDAIAAAGGSERELEYCVRLVIPYKRSNPRIGAIQDILSEFLVYPIRTKAGLEVTGTRENVENAEYIATYLNRELASIWKRARAENRHLKQKSFMIALASSYRHKLRASRQQLSTVDQRALVVMNRELEWAVDGVYGGSLVTSTSRYRSCQESASHGARAGADLSIRRGMNSRDTVKLLRD